MGKLENTDQLIAAIVDALESIKGEDIKVLDLKILKMPYANILLFARELQIRK